MATRTVARSCLNPPSSFLHSAAASFLQLTPRRCFQSSNAPILDFLAPRLQPVHTRQRQRLQSKQNHGAYANQSIKGQRSFSSTNRKLDTKAIVNASKDDDGNDMLLDITPRAAKRLREIMTKDANPNLALRIQVESGGCHGFQYLLSLSTIPSLSSSSSSSPAIPVEESPALNTSSADPNATSAPPAAASREETTKAAQEEVELDDEDVVFEDEESKAKVVIDLPSLELLKGSQVEYTTGLIGSQFAVINPNSSSNCGCGTSFDIKI